MTKMFHTEKDIEDLCKRGVTTLEVNDNVVLTQLAYEKAHTLGLKLVRDKPDHPPAAPVRPYVSQKQPKQEASPVPSGPSPAREGADLHERIRSAVVARLGAQVDAGLLDVIIRRVLASTGVK